MKDKLRKEYLSRRKRVSNKMIKDNSIFNKLINDCDVLVSGNILIYVSFSDEIDTRNIISYFFSVGKKVYVPRVVGKNMEFYRNWSFKDLKTGYRNILEPVGREKIINFDKTVCIVSGICFNESFYRIGYGGGFYDRFLSENKMISIGLCYKECLIDEEFNDEWGVSVSKVITD